MGCGDPKTPAAWGKGGEQLRGARIKGGRGDGDGGWRIHGVVDLWGEGPTG